MAYYNFNLLILLSVYKIVAEYSFLSKTLHTRAPHGNVGGNTIAANPDLFCLIIFIVSLLELFDD